MRMKRLYLTGDYTTRIQERFIYNPIYSQTKMYAQNYSMVFTVVFIQELVIFYFKKNDLKKL